MTALLKGSNLFSWRNTMRLPRTHVILLSTGLIWGGCGSSSDEHIDAATDAPLAAERAKDVALPDQAPADAPSDQPIADIAAKLDADMHDGVLTPDGSIPLDGGTTPDGSVTTPVDVAEPDSPLGIDVSSPPDVAAEAGGKNDSPASTVTADGASLGETSAALDATGQPDLDLASISLAVSPPEGGKLTVSPDVFRAGDIVTVTASPSAGWAFDHWEGILSATCVSSGPTARAHQASQVADVSRDIDRYQSLTLNGSESVGSTCTVDLLVSRSQSVTAHFSPLGFQWTQVSGAPVTLSSPTDPKPVFTVGASGVGVYEFQLVVTDPAGNSASDRTSIRLFDVDLTFTPAPGTQLSATAEQAMTISASYAGLPTGTVLHAELCASVAGATPSESTVLTVGQDFKIPADNAPDPNFATIMAFLAGRGCALARLGEVQSGQGTLGASIRFTPPTLAIAYNQILINAYGFDPLTSDITVIWTLGDQPAPIFPIAQ
jgi:hypothetical protein